MTSKLFKQSGSGRTFVGAWPHPRRAKVQSSDLLSSGPVRHDRYIDPVHRIDVDLRLFIPDAQRFYFETNVFKNYISVQTDVILANVLAPILKVMSNEKGFKPFVLF